VPLRWELTWRGVDDDWIGWSGRHRVARVLPSTIPAKRGQYAWHLNGIATIDGSPNPRGVEPAPEAAKARAEEMFQAWLRHAGLRERPPD
jgi:hypothetical protein